MAARGGSGGGGGAGGGQWRPGWRRWRWTRRCGGGERGCLSEAGLDSALLVRDLLEASEERVRLAVLHLSVLRPGRERRGVRLEEGERERRARVRAVARKRATAAARAEAAAVRSPVWATRERLEAEALWAEADLHRRAAKKVIELDGLVGGGALLVLARLAAEPEEEVVRVFAARGLGRLEHKVRIAIIERSEILGGQRHGSQTLDTPDLESRLRARVCKVRRHFSEVPKSAAFGSRMLSKTRRRDERCLLTAFWL